jgi:hypothetical protein
MVQRFRFDLVGGRDAIESAPALPKILDSARALSLLLRR